MRENERKKGGGGTEGEEGEGGKCFFRAVNNIFSKVSMIPYNVIIERNLISLNNEIH